MKIKLVVLFLLISTVCLPQTYWGRYIHSFTLQCADPDSTVKDEYYMTISYGNVTVTGTTNKAFIVFPNRCEVMVDTLIYNSFTNYRTFILTFKCTDATGASTTQKRKVILRKTNGVRVKSTVTTVL
jgi:hypothetical protein